MLTPQLIQRYATIDFITKRRLNAPLIWLQPESTASNSADAFRPPESLNTDPEQWRDGADDRNLGIRLVDGFIELQIAAADDAWAAIFFEACRSLRIDARAAYGTNRVSSIIFAIEGQALPWIDRWPQPHQDRAGHWVKTALVCSTPQTSKATKAIWRDSRPLPGSRFAGELVHWRPFGKAANDDDLGVVLDDLEARPLVPTTIEAIIRAVAFATLVYWIRAYLDGLTEWDEILTRTIGGWAARLVIEGKDINARGKSLEGVCWSPVASNDDALDLIRFLDAIGAPKSLVVAYHHAASALALNSNAKIPGWGAFETIFGVSAFIGVRRAFRAGMDIDSIERMRERYIFSTAEHVYFDRESMLKDLKYEHKYDDLVRSYDNERVFVNNKPHNPFKLYAASSLRNDVQHREFRPGSEPGSILRYSRVRGLLGPDDDHQPDEYLLFNEFKGFPVKPIGTIDKLIMHDVVSRLDKMLGLLTQNNDHQILHLKKFLAWNVQFPHLKVQSCPVIIGGQGIGKSIFGDNVMRALFGGMAGTADANSLKDNKFLITPFLGKIITFIDEVRLESPSVINTIKKLVRSEYVSGQKKFMDQTDHYVPTRLLIASNNIDIGLKPEDAADRCFFFILAWTAENKHMTDAEFLSWSLSHKPFYSEFVVRLAELPFRQHLMRYLCDIEVSRFELEDLTHSSRTDEAVVRSTMSKQMHVARSIVADARVVAGLDINAWFTIVDLRDAIKRVDGARSKCEADDVLEEWRRSSVLESLHGGQYRFKYLYGTLLQKLGEAHNLPLIGNWTAAAGDFGPNEYPAPPQTPWRGSKQGKKQPRSREPGEDDDIVVSY